MFKLEAKVLDYTGGQFTNDEGKEVKYSSCVIQTTEGVHNVNSDIDLKKYAGKEEVMLICKLEGSVKKPAKIRVLSVEETEE